MLLRSVKMLVSSLQCTAIDKLQTMFKLHLKYDVTFCSSASSIYQVTSVTQKSESDTNDISETFRREDSNVTYSMNKHYYKTRSRHRFRVHRKLWFISKVKFSLMAIFPQDILNDINNLNCLANIKHAEKIVHFQNIFFK